MLQKTKAIVLQSVRYGDTSLIVHCFTEEWGRCTFLLKGARKSKKQNRSNLFQPLFLLQLDVYFRENRELQWIKEASFISSAPKFPQNISKSTQAMFMAEVLVRTLKEEEQNQLLFHFLENVLMYFEEDKTDSPAFHALFLFQLTRFLGFYPGNNFSAERIFFDVRSGSFSTSPGSADREKESLLGHLWKQSFSLDYSSMSQVFNTQYKRVIFLDSILEFYKYHLGNSLQLKSLDVLRTVFSE